MIKRTTLILSAAVLLAVTTPGARTDADISASQLEFFENKIRPVLAESCYACHNSVDKKKGDLALDYRDALFESDVIMPGKPEESALIQAIRHEGDLEPMPYKAPRLANLIVKNFEDWIRMGAPDPRLEKPTRADLESQVAWPAVRERRSQWWSFQPLRRMDPPVASDPEWSGSPIDRFIHAGLRSKDLEAQRPASPGTLVRRLHLVLTGLPPRPDVVAAFESRPDPGAYEQLVDGLMASNQYGERWARYWMDWYRFAESHGSEGDPSIPHAGRYRDYLIRAINADVPYDQLVREHLAGDLLERPRVDEELGLNESAIGLAHLRMVPHGFGVTDAYDEQITFTDNQIDVISKAMLGITVSCARCHNHKFDPISQEDYYKLYGVMISSRPAMVNVDAPALQALHRDEMLALKTKFRAAFAAHWLDRVDAAITALEGAKLDKLAETHPLHAWATLRDSDPDAIRKELATLRARHEERVRRNEEAREGATFYADLREQSTYEGWFRSGNGLEPIVSRAGAFAIAAQGDRVLTGIYPRGVYSHLLSDRHSAVLSSVFHLARGSRASVRAMGAAADARFSVRSYPLRHGLHPVRNLKPELGWSDLGKYTYWNGEQVYYQFNTAGDSTVHAKGDRSWFGVLEVYAGSASMAETGAPLVALPGQLDGVTDRASLLARYRDALREALVAWRDDAMIDEQALLLDAFVERDFLSGKVAALPDGLRSLVDEYRRLENEIRTPVRSPGVVEAEPWDQPLLVRGDYKKEEKPIARGFLEVFGGRRYETSGSGRRELAEDILAEDNPLTARVIVNRLWHHVFGRGLVASADNFGRLGEKPSHPGLLDFLAADFRQSGWSMKRLVKQLVMSRTFRSASTEPPANAGRDPENRQLAYFSPRRLDAEAILDSIRFLGIGGIGERAVHTRVKRNALNRFLTTFNFPIPTTTVGVRNSTDVPAQALTLLNGEITRRAARQWSERIKRDPELGTDRERIEAFFLQGYARRPTSTELEALLAYIEGDTTGDSGDLSPRRDELAGRLRALSEEREQILAPVRKRLQAEIDRAAVDPNTPEPVELSPLARWDFDSDASDLVGALHGQLVGAARIEDGALVLEGGCMLTAPLARPLKEKTLEALVQLDRLEQRGGGAMTVQTTDGNVFDSIVYGEEVARVWISGSDRFARTSVFLGPREGAAVERPVRVAVVYRADGSVQRYRDGKRYGKASKKGALVTYEAGRAQVALGIRHGTRPTGGRMLTGKILEARLYDRALSDEEIAASASGTLGEVITHAKLIAALDAAGQERLSTLDTETARLTAEVDTLDSEIEQRRELREATGDVSFRIAHAILNSKELIYVH